MRERVLLEREKESCKSTGGGGEGPEERSKQGEKAGRRRRGGRRCAADTHSTQSRGVFCINIKRVMKRWRLHFEHSG